jgi:DNA-binding protein H-NS
MRVIQEIWKSVAFRTYRQAHGLPLFWPHSLSKKAPHWQICQLADIIYHIMEQTGEERGPPDRIRFAPFPAGWMALAAQLIPERPECPDMNPSFQDGEKTTMALKTMPIVRLQDLKTKIEAAISAKVSERRRELETELAELAQFDGRGGKATRSGRGGARGAVAPKYRNPENPAETWAGRGLKPRWLTAAIKGGKKIEDFAIGGAAPNAARSGKKARRIKSASKK